MVMTIKGLSLAIVLALATLMGALALAQAPSAPPTTPDSKPDDGRADMVANVELTRASIQVARQAFVTAAMDLEPKEADAFWPLYREYRQAMAQVNDRFAKLLIEYLQTYDNLTDEGATRMLKDYLSIDRDRNGVKAKYVSRFGKQIPPRKVARFFQVDNKLDAVINADLARVVPLAR